jgi:tRNA (uracil-5-)-methyltransferase
MNGVVNASVITLPSEKFASNILQNKEYRLEKQENKTPEKTSILVTFQVVLVDPPRSGLDDVTLQLVSRYKHILYISCCPGNLKEIIYFCI